MRLRRRLTVVGLLPSGSDRRPDGREVVVVIERAESPSHAAAAAVGSNVYRAERRARR